MLCSINIRRVMSDNLPSSANDCCLLKIICNKRRKNVQFVNVSHFKFYFVFVPVGNEHGPEVF